MNTLNTLTTLELLTLVLLLAATVCMAGVLITYAYIEVAPLVKWVTNKLAALCSNLWAKWNAAPVTHYARMDMVQLSFTKKEFERLLAAGEIRNPTAWTPLTAKQHKRYMSVTC